MVPGTPTATLGIAEAADYDGGYHYQQIADDRTCQTHPQLLPGSRRSLPHARGSHSLAGEVITRQCQDDGAPLLPIIINTGKPREK
jgi:hypothetical protein